MEAKDLRNYIGSQEHFEDEINADYDRIKEENERQYKEIEEEFGNEEDVDENNNFQPCEHCDLPDACEDMGCAVKCGIKQITW